MSYPIYPATPEILAGSEKRLAALTEARRLLLDGRNLSTQPITGAELVIVAQFLLDGTVPKQPVYREANVPAGTMPPATVNMLRDPEVRAR